MSDNKQINNEIKEEADDLIKLGNLLRVDRSNEGQLAVEKIIRSDWTIQQKINKIKLLDAAAAKETAQEAPRKNRDRGHPIKKHPAEKSEVITGIELPSLESKIPRKINIQYIKVTHTPLPYFTFLFREYGKLKDFGRRTHVLIPTLFPPAVKINPELGSAFTKDLIPVATQLLEVLNPVLNIGWLYLTKTDYNLLVILKKLCLKINSTNFHLLNYKDRKLIHKLRTLENLFLVLHYQPEFREKAVNSIDTVLKRNKDINVNISSVSRMIRKILTENTMLPSLYNFILGLNMCNCKRTFHLNELILRAGTDILHGDDFDCEQIVYDKIQAFIDKSVKAMGELQKKKVEIQKQKAFLPMDDEGKADFSQLQLFYDANQSENQYNYSKDKENVVIFIPQFLRLYVQTFDLLLNGKVPLMDAGSKELFSHAFFQIEFNKLSYLVKKMERIAFDFPHFPRNRYLGIKTSNTGAISIESEMMHLIEESLVHLLGTAKKLTKVLGMRQKVPQEDENTEPLDLNILRGKAFTLPYEKEFIKSETMLYGKTVHQALSMAITIVLLFGVYLNNQDSISLMNMEKTLDKKIGVILEKLERIAHKDRYLEMKEKFTTC